jgi:hypothetical protein
MDYWTFYLFLALYQLSNLYAVADNNSEKVVVVSCFREARRGCKRSLLFMKFLLSFPVTSTVAKFILPGWGDKVDSGLSYQPARLHRMAGRYDYIMPGSTISPSQGL